MGGLLLFLETGQERIFCADHGVQYPAVPWITECVEKYTPDYVRGMDSFHVVEWANEALDEVRLKAWRDATAIVKALEEKLGKPGKGKPAMDDRNAAKIIAARKNASDIKGSSFAVGKAPEHLTEKQRDTLDGIRRCNSRYYRAYEIKETLRLILRCTDRDEADRRLKKWYWWATHSLIDSFKELAKKIRRNREFILNTISYGLSNARIEATNNKIKLLIRRSYGFRNIDSMLNMIYLTCSDLKIPLPNRPEVETQYDQRNYCYFLPTFMPEEPQKSSFSFQIIRQNPPITFVLAQS